jgi:hypothetical protein
MPGCSSLKKVTALVSIAVLPFALCMGFAEARGEGIVHPSRVQEASPAERPTASPASPPVVAEREHFLMSASEAAALLDELRQRLAAQPDAQLSIRWRLIRPAGLK